MEGTEYDGDSEDGKAHVSPRLASCLRANGTEFTPFYINEGKDHCKWSIYDYAVLQPSAFISESAGQSVLSLAETLATSQDVKSDEAAGSVPRYGEVVRRPIFQRVNGRSKPTSLAVTAQNSLGGMSHSCSTKMLCRIYWF